MSTFWFGSYQVLNFCSLNNAPCDTHTNSSSCSRFPLLGKQPFLSFSLCLLLIFGCRWISAADTDTTVAAGPLSQAELWKLWF